MNRDPLPKKRMNNPFPYQFIAIEGNLGAGKTTLCKQLQERFDCRILLEQFTDNPFLPMFYENPERYAFPVELFFMTERHKQMQEELKQGDLFQQLLVSDYFFLKTLLFVITKINAHIIIYVSKIELNQFIRETKKLILSNKQEKK